MWFKDETAGSPRGHLAGHGHPAGGDHRGDHRHRRLPAAAVRPGRRVGPHAGGCGDGGNCAEVNRAEALLFYGSTMTDRPPKSSLGSLGALSAVGIAFVLAVVFGFAHRLLPRPLARHLARCSSSCSSSSASPRASSTSCGRRTPSGEDEKTVMPADADPALQPVRTRRHRSPAWPWRPSRWSSSRCWSAGPGLRPPGRRWGCVGGGLLTALSYRAIKGAVNVLVEVAVGQPGPRLRSKPSPGAPSDPDPAAEVGGRAGLRPLVPPSPAAGGRSRREVLHEVRFTGRCGVRYADVFSAAPGRPAGRRDLAVRGRAVQVGAPVPGVGRQHP